MHTSHFLFLSVSFSFSALGHHLQLQHSQPVAEPDVVADLRALPDLQQQRFRQPRALQRRAVAAGQPGLHPRASLLGDRSLQQHCMDGWRGTRVRAPQGRNQGPPCQRLLDALAVLRRPVHGWHITSDCALAGGAAGPDWRLPGLQAGPGVLLQR